MCRDSLINKKTVESNNFKDNVSERDQSNIHDLNKETKHDDSTERKPPSKKKRRGQRDRTFDQPSGPKYKKVEADDNITSALFSVGVILVIGCAYAAIKGWRGRISVAGIDLGTTNSVICIQALSRSVGEIDCISDPYSGSPLIPSVVSFEEFNTNDLNELKPIVGRAASERMNAHARSTVSLAKRFLGRSFGDDVVRDQALEVEFEVVEDTEGISLVEEFAEKGGIAFRIQPPHSNVEPKLFSPEMIGSYVVKHLINLTNNFLGYENIKSAVIAVPAKFTMLQRQATAQAFKLAGIKVARVLEEPVAAALAYGLHRKPDVDHILVYDFGGGTLDVSILMVSEGFVDVMASEGDDTLGGADFDAAIAHSLMEKSEYAEILAILAKAEAYISSRISENVLDVEEFLMENCPKIDDMPLCSSSSFHTIGEKMKIQLSSSNVANESCMGLKNVDISQIGGVDELCQSLSPIHLSFTSDDFLNSSARLLERSRIPIRNVLSSMDLNPGDIDEVVMVGGTSRMPVVRELVKDELQVQNLNTSIDPDITVAYGCASVID